MKTIVIWDQCGTDDIRFFVLDGNFAHLSNTYIGKYTEDQEEQNRIEELLTIVYGEGGDYIVELLDTFPHDVITDMYGRLNMATVIVAGFAP